VIAKLHRDEGGFTLVELSLAMILGAIISGAMVGVFFSLSQNAADSARTAELQQTVRSMVAEIVIEIRQAQKATPNGDPIESLDADRFVFYTDRAEIDGPERVVYERTDCSGGFCELWVRRYPAVAGTEPDWEFGTTPFEQSFLLGLVRDDAPMFRGVEWSGDPKVETYLASCTGQPGSQCDFPMVSLRVRANPANTSAGADAVFEVVEQVRLRNAS
jgi:prepilin-type N-terminal cleavage/methylation domain-containing protein